MKKRGLFFAIAAIIMVGIVWGNPITRIKATFFPEIPVLLPADESLAAVNISVDEALLWQHVNAIAQPRFTNAQKQPIRSYITAQLKSYGISPVEQPYVHPKTKQADTGGVNIIATLPGSDPTAGSILLGAHYDAHETSPGADDNASAIAALLETARLLSSLPPEQAFPTTLKLLFFDQEERQPDGSGLLGSLAYTLNNKNLDSIKGAVILDMIGFACRTAGCQQYPQGIPLQNLPDTGEFLAVLGLSDHPELIGAFAGSAQNIWPAVYSLPLPKATLNIFPDLLRSDHAPFWEKDVPAVFVTDTANFRNPNYHTQQDLPATLDGPFFKGCAQHVVNAVTTLLSQPVHQSE
ncbi:MAG: M28 family peptidase [Cyanobacteria bacterium J06626_6]